MEIGGSRGYSTIRLAAAVRILGGRVLLLEADSRKIDAWRRNISDAGWRSGRSSSRTRARRSR